jgi:hypothetical protein
MATKNQIEVKKYITPDIKKKMTKWEKEFISSIYNFKKDWTEKQLATFNNIKRKYGLEERIVVEKIVYLPLGYAHGAKINQEITSKNFRKNRAKIINSNKKIR